MKIIQEIFDETGYMGALRKEFDRLRHDQFATATIANSLSLGDSFDPNQRVAEMVKKEVDRAQFVTVNEYDYLGAVTVDNKPCLLVYDEAGTIKTISITGCKIINESNGEETVK